MTEEGLNRAIEFGQKAINEANKILEELNRQEETLERI